MSAVTSSSISLNLDLQAVFTCVGSDIVMFVSAMIAFAVLHHMKKATMVKVDVDKPPKTVLVQASCETAACTPAESVTAHVSAVPRVPPSPTTGDTQTQIQHAPDQQVVDTSTKVKLLRKYAFEGNIKETLSIFRAIRKSSVPLESSMYNSVLQAWVRCGNVWAAESWMDEMKDANMVDANTFAILMKALVMVRDFDRARNLLQDMRSSCVEKSAETFEVILAGIAREGSINDGAFVLKEMEAAGLEPNSATRHLVATLVNSARNFNQGLACLRQISVACGLSSECHSRGVRLEFRDVPRLAFLLSNCKDVKSSECVHDVEIQGAHIRLRAVQKTLKQHGFLERADSDEFPLDGHWQTDHGLTVIIEGKTVRWSKERASRLRFTSSDKRQCELVVYGQLSKGHLVQPLSPYATKSLKWDNGDVWHSHDGRVIGGTTFFEQSMTKIRRDHIQDKAYQARVSVAIKSVSRQGLGLPSILEGALMQYLGSDLHCLNIRFENKTARLAVFEALSRRHPLVGFRHCWIRPSSNSCGQRTLVNGSETDEECFNRHIGAVARV